MGKLQQNYIQSRLDPILTFGETYTVQTKNGQNIVQKVVYNQKNGLTGADIRPQSETGEAVVNTIKKTATATINAADIIGWCANNWQLLVIGGVALLLLVKRL